MLHHVGIEVAPEDVEAMAGFWELLGFEPVEPPPALAEFTWLERQGTQIHLMPADSPAVPARGHVAIVVDDFEAAVAALEGAGFEVERRAAHWGAFRAKATAPGGHVVELMAAPPPSAPPAD